MNSQDSSSKSTTSGSQGTGLWVTAAIAMAIIVGAPLLIHSGADRGHRSAERGQPADQRPAAEVAPSDARRGAEGSAALQVGAVAVSESEEAAVTAAVSDIAFGPGPRRTAVPPPTSGVAEGPVEAVSGGGSRPEPAEPVVAEEGPSDTDQPQSVGPEPIPATESPMEAPTEGVPEPSSVGQDRPPQRQTVSASAPQGVEPLKTEESAQVPSGETPSRELPAKPPMVASGTASASADERPGSVQGPPVDSSQSGHRLAEIVAELRSMEREAERERGASEPARAYYPTYGRPFYPLRSEPAAPPGGYGYHRQGPPGYYAPPGRPWGYPGPIPQGAGQLP